MNWDQVEGNWKQVKGSFREQWGRLTRSSKLPATASGWRE